VLLHGRITDFWIWIPPIEVFVLQLGFSSATSSSLLILSVLHHCAILYAVP
jgi:hypothetical protein